MSIRGLLLAVMMLAGGLGPAAAQIAPDPENPIPPADIPLATAPKPLPDGSLAVIPESLPTLPYADPGQDSAIGTLDLTPVIQPKLVLNALLVEDGQPLRSGLVWRVFGSTPGPDGKLTLIAQAQGGSASFDLKSGIYYVYCSFGFAGTTDRVEVTNGIRQENVILNAGGVKFSAETANNEPLISDDLVFDVYSLQTDERGEKKPVAQGVKRNELLRLTADTYHVVSRYGSINAEASADIEVKAGKLMEISLIQRAAKVTLKLVGAPGGEAIADTRWTVLTPGGDLVAESVGAFPSFILAEGGYTVIARHDDAVFQRDLDVESGRDGEVEVLADIANVPKR
jgi:hypothetical protein